MTALLPAQQAAFDQIVNANGVNTAVVTHASEDIVEVLVNNLAVVSLYWSDLDATVCLADWDEYYDATVDQQERYEYESLSAEDW